MFTGLRFVILWLVCDLVWAVRVVFNVAALDIVWGSGVAGVVLVCVDWFSGVLG